jgi:8-oxo-dGTP pyrophosphatase MutT (NUDIX family)
MKADPETELRTVLGRIKGSSSDYDLNPSTVLPAGRTLRPAGVLVPIQIRNGDPWLYLTKRSSALKHHPGQIAFPGGKQDPEDASIVDTALREAREEIGLESKLVEIIGTAPSHETVTSFEMTPVIGIIKGRFTPIPEPGEVEEVFDVPLAHVLKPENFSIQYRRWRGSRRHYYTVPYGPYYIWGATARILRAIAEAWSVR